MPFPPTVPPTTRANSTAQLDTHPGDHNQIAAALNTLVAKITNSAWGIVAMVAVTASSPTTTTAAADMPGCAVTFTPDPTRRYKLWAGSIQVVSVATNVVSCRIRDSANAVLAEASIMPTAANVGHFTLPTALITWPTATPVTLKLSYMVLAGAGNTYLYADAANNAAATRLVVEDVGPITRVVVP